MLALPDDNFIKATRELVLAGTASSSVSIAVAPASQPSRLGDRLRQSRTRPSFGMVWLTSAPL